MVEAVAEGSSNEAAADGDALASPTASPSRSPSDKLHAVTAARTSVSLDSVDERAEDAAEDSAEFAAASGSAGMPRRDGVTGGKVPRATGAASASRSKLREGSKSRL